MTEKTRIEKKIKEAQEQIDRTYPLGTKRTFENQLIRVRLKCGHRGCKKYIQGAEGYNGNFYYKGKRYDLRNQGWFCSKKHKNGGF